jgi:hypothetical protein
VFCTAVPIGLNDAVAGVDDDDWWGDRVPLEDVTAGTALALSVPNNNNISVYDPVNDERGCWAESSVLATALGCSSSENRACLTGGPSDF